MEIGEVGQTVITRGLAAALEKNKELSKDVHLAWQRYLQCDWGNLGEERQGNEQQRSKRAKKRPHISKV